MVEIDLLEEYKELYYKEIEFNDRLNNKITTCITFLTVLGSALIFLLTQIKNYDLCWYTILYFVFCIIDTIMFFICVYMFFKTYSGYDRPMFPIKEIAIQNTNILNQVTPDKKDESKEIIGQIMSQRFINDAVKNRELNLIKNKKHYYLIRMIMATFIVSFITFVINISIDYYESKSMDENIQQSIQKIYIRGGDINVR